MIRHLITLQASGTLQWANISSKKLNWIYKVNAAWIALDIWNSYIVDPSYSKRTRSEKQAPVMISPGAFLSGELGRGIALSAGLYTQLNTPPVNTSLTL